MNINLPLEKTQHRSEIMDKSNKLNALFIWQIYIWYE